MEKVTITVSSFLGLTAILLTHAPAGKPAPVISTGAVPAATPVGSSSRKTFPLEVPKNKLVVATLYVPLERPIAEILLPTPTAVPIPVIKVQVPEVTVEAVVVLYNFSALA